MLAREGGIAICLPPASQIFRENPYLSTIQ